MVNPCAEKWLLSAAYHEPLLEAVAFIPHLPCKNTLSLETELLTGILYSAQV